MIVTNTTAGGNILITSDFKVPFDIMASEAIAVAGASRGKQTAMDRCLSSQLVVTGQSGITVES